MAQTDAAELARSFCAGEEDRLRLIPALYRRTGVETRHSVLLESDEGPPLSRQSFYPAAEDGSRGPATSLRMQEYERGAAPLAVDASRAALAEADISPSRVTHLLTVSCSGFHAPGFDIALIRELGLKPQVARTHVGFMGCHGAFNALRVARAFLQADPRACVLVCAVELCSLHYQYGWDPDRIVSNALFADGAAALVACAGTRSEEDWRILASGSTIVKDTEDAMTWRIGDYGFEMTLSARVPDLIRRDVRPWLEGWLAEQGLTLESVGSWAVHPGGPRILSAFREGVGLKPDALAVSEQILARYGNMSSPTIVFIVDQLRRQQAPRPCLALGFGPGLTVEAMLIG